MINEKLINPGSIVVIGGSDDLFKPGGKVLKEATEAGRVGTVLAAVVRALLGAGIHPDTRLIVDNLLTGESRAILLGGLQADVAQ